MGSLTKDYFQEMLRKHEENDTIVLEKLNISPAVDKGNNFASIVSRVKVLGFKIDDNNKKVEYRTALIVKQLVKNKLFLEKFHFDVIFLNEAAAYNTIIPALKKHTIQKDTFNTATCVHADGSIVVLKDLAEDGFRNVNKKHGFSIDEIKLILTELAKLHAASFVMNHRDPDPFLQLPGLLRDVVFNDSEVDTTFAVASQNMNIDIAVRVISELPADDLTQRALATLEDMRATAYKRQLALVTEPRAHRVICHGDTWGNNILLSEQDTSRAVLIDLQVMRYVSLAADLSYFLYVNMRPSERRRHFEDLLRHYLTTVHEQLEGCGVSDLTEVLTYDWLRVEMRAFAIFGVVSALWLLPVFYFNVEDMNLEEFSEEQISDIDWHMKKLTPEYKERLIELIVDYVENDL